MTTKQFSDEPLTEEERMIIHLSWLEYSGDTQNLGIIRQLQTRVKGLEEENNKHEQKIENLTANRDAISKQIPKIHEAYTDKIQTLERERDEALKDSESYEDKYHTLCVYVIDYAATEDAITGNPTLRTRMINGAYDKWEQPSERE